MSGYTLYCIDLSHLNPTPNTTCTDCHEGCQYKTATNLTQLLTCVWPCVGICQAMALIGDAKQAMNEGKGGPIKTQLT